MESACETRFRFATPSDIQALQSVVEDCWAADYPTVISSATIKDGLLDWYEESHLRREIWSADTLVAIAEVDGEVQGFANAVLNGAEGIIVRLYIVPEYRRRGIGTDLFEFTIEELTDRGVERIVALALARNDVAAEFFHVAGFERVGTDTTTIAGEKYDEIVFERTI